MRNRTRPAGFRGSAGHGLPCNCAGGFFLKVSVPLPFAAFDGENQFDKRVGLKIRAQEVSNIKWRYLGESAPYVPVCRRNIGHCDSALFNAISNLNQFEEGTENPRV
jgi:hypothetical protein